MRRAEFLYFPPPPGIHRALVLDVSSYYAEVRTGREARKGDSRRSGKLPSPDTRFDRGDFTKPVVGVLFQYVAVDGAASADVVRHLAR